ncbi:hypothetical protein A8C75_18660 [Marinobacterium aestuarii]|uniref:Uncharacterized protein n=1 Tax=Marinobacterium aestuarii TaxID=1821621 RepID=A0A1A9F2A8_9GAMM|nr:hypothetical protein A8C75_18660 [Marinobacterium aestuarii]
MLGTVKAVASDTDTEAVYRWARDYGYWAELPEDESTFIKTIQIMSIEFDGGNGNEEITVLMSRTDYDAIAIKPGDLVRYIPHESDNPLPSYAQGVAQHFWNLFGCIAVLCREDDIKCRKRYVTGIYRVADGVELNSHGDQSEELAKRIDPITYLPLQSRTY